MFYVTINYFPTIFCEGELLFPLYGCSVWSNSTMYCAALPDLPFQDHNMKMVPSGTAIHVLLLLLLAAVTPTASDDVVVVVAPAASKKMVAVAPTTLDKEKKE